MLCKRIGPQSESLYFLCTGTEDEVFTGCCELVVIGTGAEGRRCLRAAQQDTVAVFYHQTCLGQDKLQVSEQHFDATCDCYNRGGWVKFKSICITLFIAVAKDIDAAVAAGNFPEGWY